MVSVYLHPTLKIDIQVFEGNVHVESRWNGWHLLRAVINAKVQKRQYIAIEFFVQCVCIYLLCNSMYADCSSLAKVELLRWVTELCWGWAAFPQWLPRAKLLLRGHMSELTQECWTTIICFADAVNIVWMSESCPASVYVDIYFMVCKCAHYRDIVRCKASMVKIRLKIRILHHFFHFVIFCTSAFCTFFIIPTKCTTYCLHYRYLKCLTAVRWHATWYEIFNMLHCSHISKWKAWFHCVLQQFIDSLRVYVRGGTGGQGLAKYNGIGGRGGDVFVVGEEKKTLKNIYQMFPTKRFSASKGEDSRCARYYVHVFINLLHIFIVLFLFILYLLHSIIIIILYLLYLYLLFYLFIIVYLLLFIYYRISLFWYLFISVYIPICLVIFLIQKKVKTEYAWTVLDNLHIIMCLTQSSKINMLTNQ